MAKKDRGQAGRLELHPVGSGEMLVEILDRRVPRSLSSALRDHVPAPPFSRHRDLSAKPLGKQRPPGLSGSRFGAGC